MIDPGKLNDRIEIQERHFGIPPGGGFQQEYFTTVATVWAHFRPTGGREFRSAGVEIGEERATFSIMYRELSQVDRVIFRGVVWNIVHVARVGFNESLDINCTSTGMTPQALQQQQAES